MKQIVFVDTETTGLGSDDEILSLAIVDENGRKLFYELIKPQNKRTWPEAQKINGISPKDVADRKTLVCFLDELEEWLGGKYLIGGYNIDFDMRMLRQSGYAAHGLETIDVMAMSEDSLGYRPKLVDIALLLGYEFQAHDALNDARATAYVYRQLKQEYVDAKTGLSGDAKNADAYNVRPNGGDYTWKGSSQNDTRNKPRSIRNVHKSSLKHKSTGCAALLTTLLCCLVLVIPLTIPEDIGMTALLVIAIGVLLWRGIQELKK